jgi:hypothetical protein
MSISFAIRRSFSGYVLGNDRDAMLDNCISFIHTIEPFEQFIARNATPTPPCPIRVPRRQAKSIIRVFNDATGSNVEPLVAVVVLLYICPICLRSRSFFSNSFSHSCIRCSIRLLGGRNNDDNNSLTSPPLSTRRCPPRERIRIIID